MRHSAPMTRRAGIGLAVAAALTSGVAVYVNGFAVLHAPSATSFTTAKNLVAALLVGAVAAAGIQVGDLAQLRRLSPGQWLGLGYIGVVGGGVAFALFFEGLARGNATQSAFVQKSLVVWVAIIAVPLLGERLRPAHLGAIAMLMAGQLLLTGDVTRSASTLSLAMVLGATLLWAVEVVVARHLLAVVPSPLLGAARMTVGSAVLLGWLAVTHHAGQLGGIGAGWGWVVATGVILAAYVTLWFGALRRAPAIDVTAVLVGGAIVTALLSARGTQLSAAAQAAGVVLVLVGVIVIARRSAAARAAVVAVTP